MGIFSFFSKEKKETLDKGLSKTKENVFTNIQITMHENEFVMISKNKAPTIHFVIRHPILRRAIERPEFPVFEQKQ